MARTTSFLLIIGRLFSSPWVAKRQYLYSAMPIQCQYSIFLNLLKVTLISHLIYCSSRPKHHCVFHIMISVFRSIYAMWEPHFQKCLTILGACLPACRIRRNPSFLCPLGWTQHCMKGSVHTRLYFGLRFGLHRKETWTHSLEGPRERAGQDWSFLWLFSPLLMKYELVSTVEAFEGLPSLGLPWVAAAGISHGCERPQYEVTPGMCARLCFTRTPARGKMDMGCPHIITQRWAGQIKLKMLLPLLPSHNSWFHMQPSGLTVVTPGKSLACSVQVPCNLHTCWFWKLCHKTRDVTDTFITWFSAAEWRLEGFPLLSEQPNTYSVQQEVGPWCSIGYSHT